MGCRTGPGAARLGETANGELRRLAPTLLLAALFLLSVVAVLAVTPGSILHAPSPSGRTQSHIATLARPGPGTERQLQPNSVGGSLSIPTVAGPQHEALPSVAWLNQSRCDPSWPSMPIGLAPINATVVWTGNTTGATPLTINWTITIGGGGIPPYQVVVDFVSIGWATFDANFTSLNGSVVLSTPGMYFGVAEVVDSTCDAVSASYVGPITVYPVSGLNPLQISASTTGGPAPLSVQYSTNATRIPGNTTVLWSQPFSYLPGGWDINATYYTAGNYSAVACLVNSTSGVWLACAGTGLVNVTGSIITTASRVANGSLPVNITYWVNVTNRSALPANWTVDLSLNNGTSTLVTSQNASTSGTASFGCGPSTPTNPPKPSGVCTWAASYLVTAQPNGSAVFVAKGVVWANISEAGSPVLWYPTVTYIETPTNGTAPLNVTVNVTATNGLAPYQYWWAVFGASSAAPNRTFYPTLTGNNTNSSAWNGSTLSLVFPLTVNGIYLITITVADANHNAVFLYPPVIPVGVALAHRPLKVSAAETTISAGNQFGSRVQFLANVSGGEGPYTVQWTFGDGSYGASVPGSAVTHTYGSPGLYVPAVTVTDRSGRSTTTSLPSVTVLPQKTGVGSNPNSPGSGRQPQTASGGSPWNSPLSSVLSAGHEWTTLALIVATVSLLAAAIFQAERKRSADRMVDSLESEAQAPQVRAKPPQ
ncbi:MAG: PKD domain-containing protein [Thermoplasmata archaeon]|nr:PKD domain-containing protein [Thermoplasmata archaeon]